MGGSTTNYSNETPNSLTTRINSFFQHIPLKMPQAFNPKMKEFLSHLRGEWRCPRDMFHCSTGLLFEFFSCPPLKCVTSIPKKAMLGSQKCLLKHHHFSFRDKFPGISLPKNLTHAKRNWSPCLTLHCCGRSTISLPG